MLRNRLAPATVLLCMAVLALFSAQPASAHRREGFRARCLVHRGGAQGAHVKKRARQRTGMCSRAHLHRRRLRRFGSPARVGAPRGTVPGSGNASTAPVSTTSTLFAPNSIWNRVLPADTALDPNSGPMVSALAQEAHNEWQNGTGPWVATDSYSTTYYTVGADQPTVSVALDSPIGVRASLQAAFSAVPIPANAIPGGGTDAVMTIYQPSTDRLWEFWEARKLSDGWHAAWGGAIQHVSTSPGYYTTSSWTSAATNWGAGASSLPVVGGMMTMSELRAGQINHALSIALPNTRGGAFAWPAQRTDGTNGDPSSIPEGAQLRLDPNLNVPALHLPPITQMIALAAQRYGIVVTNRTNSEIGFYAEDPNENGHASYASGGPAPYYGAGGLFDGLWPSAFLHDFPWASLQVVRMQLQSLS
jgi:hypothetical protein